MLTFSGRAGAQTTIQHPSDVFPGKTWDTVTREELGWSVGSLDEARKFFDTLPPVRLAKLKPIHRLSPRRS
jgi:hypothetical protein